MSYKKIFVFSCSAPGCDAIIYDGMNRGGRSVLLRQQNANFVNDNFNDRVESADIKGKCKWLFFEHINFIGASVILDHKYYKTPCEFAHLKNKFSSGRALPPDGQKALVLFRHVNYQGRMLVLYKSEPNSIYSFHHFNDHASSAIVTGGQWTLFDHGHYRGAKHVLKPGFYPRLPRAVYRRLSSVALG